MKLTKSKLTKVLKPLLLALGYIEFKDRDSNGFFVKKLSNGLYLSLGLTIHRFYENMFTCSYYLSPTTRWSSVWKDIPRDSYERPGLFLSKEERQLYLRDEFNQDGIIDVWWDGFSDEDIKNFIKTIEVTESRFINQPELIERIWSSSAIRELVILAKETQNIVLENKMDDNLSFQPNKEIDDVPFIWYKAAETVLNKQETSIPINKNTVIALATDAWRQNILDLYN